MQYVVEFRADNDDGWPRAFVIVEAATTEEARDNAEPPHMTSGPDDDRVEWRNGPIPEPHRTDCQYCGANFPDFETMLEHRQDKHEYRHRYFDYLSVVRPVRGSHSWEYRREHDFEIREGDHVLWLGEVANVLGHCAVATQSGKVIWLLHPDEFELVPDDAP